jgi:hypothetical protein
VSSIASQKGSNLPQAPLSLPSRLLVYVKFGAVHSHLYSKKKVVIVEPTRRLPGYTEESEKGTQTQDASGS